MNVIVTTHIIMHIIGHKALDKSVGPGRIIRGQAGGFVRAEKDVGVVLGYQALVTKYKRMGLGRPAREYARNPCLL